jgi:hypothetical protein
VALTQRSRRSWTTKRTIEFWAGADRGQRRRCASDEPHGMSLCPPADSIASEHRRGSWPMEPGKRRRRMIGPGRWHAVVSFGLRCCFWCDKGFRDGSSQGEGHLHQASVWRHQRWKRTQFPGREQACVRFMRAGPVLRKIATEDEMSEAQGPRQRPIAGPTGGQRAACWDRGRDTGLADPPRGEQTSILYAFFPFSLGLRQLSWESLRAHGPGSGSFRYLRGLYC